MNEESYFELDQFGNSTWRNKKGKLHRLNGPAVISNRDGYNIWYRKGKYHREDGPAVEYASGAKYWYQKGKFHRLDGPAVILSSGHKEWHIRGNRHREDGPAVINSDGSNQWWLNNVFYETKEDWFDALSDEAKMKCIFSEGFLNG
jgi:hypothetical protein